MPGLRIMHYLVDLGYREPTRFYAVVQEPNGDLKINKIYQMPNASLELIYHFYQQLEVRRPLVFLDEPIPPIREFFRSKGVRVR